MRQERVEYRVKKGNSQDYQQAVTNRYEVRARERVKGSQNKELVAPTARAEQECEG